MVSGSLSLSSSECFSPFLHSTGSLSVSWEYLALPDGPGGFAQDSSCPALLRIPLGRLMLRVQVFHLLWMNFPDHSAHNQRTTAWSYNPGDALPQRRFGLVPVRSPLLGESLFIFSSSRYYDVSVPSVSLLNPQDDRPPDGRVVPFGNPWIKGYLHLPKAYRSLSRPSSPP